MAVPKNLPVYGTMDKCLYLNTYLLEMYAGVDKWLYLKTYLCMEQWTVSVLEHLPAGNIWRSGQAAVPDNLSVYGKVDKCLYLNTYLLEMYVGVGKLWT